jgi:manganese/zinc/iron transport system substrate-binding protein
VLATTGMIADVVKNVGGEHVDVIQLMGAGVDPHLYTARESDVVALVRADIIFYNGIHLEARMAEVFERISDSRLTVAVGGAVPEHRLLHAEGFPEGDPHIWMDVELWMRVTERIRDTLVEFDPAHADAYAANAEAYLAELQDLDDYIHAQMARVPERQRVLVTAHDAFQYYGHAYGIEVFAPQGITTQAEAGVEDIRRTIDLLAERDIPAIFVETSVPPDVIEAIIEGARARGHIVTIGGELFSDAMGDPNTPEGTYIGMIKHNTDTIVSALLGEADASASD